MNDSVIKYKQRRILLDAIKDDKMIGWDKLQIVNEVINQNFIIKSVSFSNSYTYASETRYYVSIVSGFRLYDISKNMKYLEFNSNFINLAFEIVDIDGWIKSNYDKNIIKI